MPLTSAAATAQHDWEWGDAFVLKGVQSAKELAAQSAGVTSTDMAIDINSTTSEEVEDDLFSALDIRVLS